MSIEFVVACCTGLFFWCQGEGYCILAENFRAGLEFGYTAPYYFDGKHTAFLKVDLLFFSCIMEAAAKWTKEQETRSVFFLIIIN